MMVGFYLICTDAYNIWVKETHHPFGDPFSPSAVTPSATALQHNNSS